MSFEAFLQSPSFSSTVLRTARQVKLPGAYIIIFCFKLWPDLESKTSRKLTPSQQHMFEPHGCQLGMSDIKVEEMGVWLSQKLTGFKVFEEIPVIEEEAFLFAVGCTVQIPFLWSGEKRTDGRMGGWMKGGMGGGERSREGKRKISLRFIKGWP